MIQHLCDICGAPGTPVLDHLESLSYGPDFLTDEGNVSRECVQINACVRHPDTSLLAGKSFEDIGRPADLCPACARLLAEKFTASLITRIKNSVKNWPKP